MPGNFSGDVTPEQAWLALANDPNAVLVDVRTKAEWTYVGCPDLSTLSHQVNQILLVEWQRFPTMEINPSFLEEIRDGGIATDQPLYLICRSGFRSRAAAEFLAGRGFTTHNITDGFEGQLDSDCHRGSRNGWKTAGLPWKQS